MVAETTVRRQRSWCCRCSCARAPTEPRPISLDARRRPAHPRLAAEGGQRGGRAAGLGGVMLFGVPETKDAVGSGAIDPHGILNLAITDVVAEVGDAAHGDERPVPRRVHRPRPLRRARRPTARVDNDRTLEVYGADGAGPGRRRRRPGRPERDDGRPGRARSARALDAAGAHRRRRSWPTPRSTPRPSSARSARPSTPRCRATGAPTSRTPPTRVEGVREALLDVAEGADIVMVKPALGYLDVRRRGARRGRRPGRGVQRLRRVLHGRGRRRPAAGSTARPRSWRRSPRSAGPAPTWC